MSANDSVLGIRFSTKELFYTLIRGNQGAPIIIEHRRLQYPKGLPLPATLKWLRQELLDLCHTHSVVKLVIKGCEPNRFAKPNIRTDCEAIGLLVAAELGLRDTVRKVNSTIAVDMGLKGRAKYLSQINTSLIPGYEALKLEQIEALLAAWSELHG